MSVAQVFVAFKVELKRRDREGVFHRFSGAYSYSELSTVISHLWGERPKHLVLDYTDDEGDQVRFTTEAEWQECVRIHQASGATVLRLTGKRAKDVKSPTKRDSKKAADLDDVHSASESDAEVDLADVSLFVGLERQSGSDTSVPVLPAIARQPQQQLNLDPLSQAAAAQLEASLFVVSSQPASQSASMNSRVPNSTEAEKEAEVAQPQVECDANSAAVDLMSLMYNCDAGVELFKGATEKFGSVVKRVVNPFAPAEVHLDIDRSILYREVVLKSNTMIDSKEYVQAEQLLRTACVLFTDSVILEYNLACVLSLQGRLEESLELLLAARAHGYDDIQQLQTDADLANVRNHPRFVEVVPAPMVAVAPVVEVEPTPIPAPAAAAPSAPVDPKVMTLMSIFPEMTIDEATNAMTRAGGNLARAVNARLSGN